MFGEATARLAGFNPAVCRPLAMPTGGAVQRGQRKHADLSAGLFLCTYRTTSFRFMPRGRPLEKWRRSSNATVFTSLPSPASKISAFGSPSSACSPSASTFGAFEAVGRFLRFRRFIRKTRPRKIVCGLRILVSFGSPWRRALFAAVLSPPLVGSARRAPPPRHWPPGASETLLSKSVLKTSISGKRAPEADAAKARMAMVAAGRELSQQCQPALDRPEPTASVCCHL